MKKFYINCLRRIQKTSDTGIRSNHSNLAFKGFVSINFHKIHLEKKVYPPPKKRRFLGGRAIWLGVVIRFLETSIKSFRRTNRTKRIFKGRIANPGSTQINQWNGVQRVHRLCFCTLKMFQWFWWNVLVSHAYILFVLS